MISISLNGVTTVLAALSVTEAVTGKGFERGCKEAGEFVLTESQKIVPYKTGALSRSGRTYAEGKGWNLKQYVAYGPVYGNKGYDYSVRQHEDLSYYHSSPRQAKFISDPIEWYKKTILNIVKKHVIRGF